MCNSEANGVAFDGWTGIASTGHTKFSWRRQIAPTTDNAPTIVINVFDRTSGIDRLVRKVQVIMVPDPLTDIAAHVIEPPIIGQQLSDGLWLFKLAVKPPSDIFGKTRAGIHGSKSGPRSIFPLCLGGQPKPI